MRKSDPERQERERLYRIWLNKIDASMNENLAPWLKAFTTVLQREDENSKRISIAEDDRSVPTNGV